MATDLLSTEERRRLAYYTLLRREPLSVRKVAGELKLDPSFVSRYFSRLMAAGLMSKQFCPLQQKSLARATKLFLNVAKLQPLIAAARSIFESNMLGIAIYGSWARGENYYDSDLDLWVKTKKRAGLEESSRFLSKLSLGEVNLEVLWPEKIAELKDRDKSFYSALSLGSFVLEGEGLES